MHFIYDDNVAYDTISFLLASFTGAQPELETPKNLLKEREAKRT